MSYKDDMITDAIKTALDYSYKCIKLRNIAMAEAAVIFILLCIMIFG